ncbi:AMP-binding enzyme [Cupriavidus necator]|uniref:AMP-binding enzyme n=1 Tax=Cupriavidus necator TaxID=106590 RepID=A0A1K0IPR2_CUPNE|nr:AMP-binding enzyme [Cupriavidus necator]
MTQASTAPKAAIATDIQAAFGCPESWTMASILARRAELSGDRVFLRFMPDGRSYTYRDLHRETNGIAHALRAMGVGYRDHAAVISENCPEQLFSFFALGKLGAVSVPINTAAKGALLRDYLARADCSALIVAESLVDGVLEIAAALPLLRCVVVIGDPARAQGLFAGTAVAVHGFPADCATDDAVESTVVFSDLAYLMYTSGTTGPSKAIMIPHVCAHFWGEQTIRYRYYRPDDVDYVFLPVFHASALLIQVTGSLMAGGTVALTPRFSASRFWADVRACGATRFNSIGAVGQFLWSQPPGPQDRDHKLRLCSLAPAPWFVLDFEKRFGVRVINGYALSDYCAATWRPLDASPEKIFSCGIPRDEVSVRIVDDNDFDVPPGTPGEILLRNEQPWATPLGYYKMPEATVAAQRNLWFHTGDRGYLDQDGYLYFTDRKKDAMRRRGENISAFEVESVILGHAAVKAVAVYAVRSELTEDEVAASVVLQEGTSLSAEDLVRYCAGNMSAYMVPRFIEFIDALPLTPTSKVEKYKLRERAQASPERLWDRDRQMAEYARRQ